MTKTILHNYLT